MFGSLPGTTFKVNGFDWIVWTLVASQSAACFANWPLRWFYFLAALCADMVFGHANRSMAKLFLCLVGIGLFVWAGRNKGIKPLGQATLKMARFSAPFFIAAAQPRRPL